jgi:integrase
MYKVYKILNLESELFKSKIDYYVKKQTIHQDKYRELNKKTTQEGDAIIEYFEKKVTELETVQEDTDLLNNWSQEVQLYCILKIYLTYGVMRPSEIVDCLICNCDGDDTTNYINVNTKQIVINNHKNDRKGKKVIDISSDKKLLGILRKVIGQFLVTNQQGELYQSSSAFTKMFKSHFNDYTPYDLRKAISSKYIAEGDVEKIKKLEHNQSHSLQVILDNYNVYTKSS